MPCSPRITWGKASAGGDVARMETLHDREVDIIDRRHGSISWMHLDELGNRPQFDDAGARRLLASPGFIHGLRAYPKRKKKNNAAKPCGHPVTLGGPDEAY